MRIAARYLSGLMLVCLVAAGIWGVAAQRSAAADIAHPAATSPAATASPRMVDARATIDAAVKAIGGIERVRSVRNITLKGSGYYAYQMGLANVVATPMAAKRMMGAMNLERIYDLEHNRFRISENRNMLFTFARSTLTSWAPYISGLDGDIAFDIDSTGKATRIARWFSTTHFLEGQHMFRMWMMNNPVVALRRALDPATRISNPHIENGQAAIDLQLAEGDKFSMGFDPRTHLPAWIRWSNPQINFGQLTLTTYLEGYVPVAGLLLPFSYRTLNDWRDTDHLQLFLEGYDVDSDIPDLSAPEAVRNQPEPIIPTTYKVEITQTAPHVWNLKYGDEQASIAFEFDDHITLYELDRKPPAQSVIDAAKTLVPGKLPTQLITSHGHGDHVAGIRVAVANGLTIITRRGNEAELRAMANHPAPDYPDALAKHPRPIKFILVDEHLRLSDKTNTVDVYWAGANTHMADALFAYVPASKIFVEADIATAAFDYQYWPDSFEDLIEYYKLDVAMLMPVHFGTPMTRAEANDFIRAGLKRARENCAAEAARGALHFGCPVLTKRY